MPGKLFFCNLLVAMPEWQQPAVSTTPHRNCHFPDRINENARLQPSAAAGLSSNCDKQRLRYSKLPLLPPGALSHVPQNTSKLLISHGPAV